MQSKTISADYTVAGQISPEDVPAIAAEGFRTIVCNRPDGEAPDQPPFAEIEAAAKSAGLEFRYLPVVSGQITAEDVDAFRTAINQAPQPVFAYCRSGTRSQNLWLLARQPASP